MKRNMLIVDGHNALHAVPEWCDLQQLHPEAARYALIQTLTRFQDHSHYEVAVVFDGSGRKVKRLPSSTHDIQVVFSGQGLSADLVIERVATRYAEEMNLLIASNDRLVREICSAAGAQTCSIAQLLDLLDQAAKQFRQKNRKHGL